MKGPARFSDADRLAASWIERMAGGDIDALNTLYNTYHRQLLGLFTVILRDTFEAEEVLQDTFIRAYRQADHFNREIGTPFAWLTTIGKRLSIDRLRRRRSRPNLSTDSREHLGQSEDNEFGNVQQQAHQHLEYDWMRDRLGKLTKSQRETIELAFFGGYTHHEIAEKLNRPLGTVKSDLHRGLLQLRKAYLEGND
ncbi:MAG TPA: sigma-70 family RNA polymerase sigma factor [Oceanipulchritudo sp.]|nr:sigma-70 family RNA polymerase sigma factor [Oceanipulchritudo sp.]